MTKTDLIAQVAANTEMSKKSAEMAVNAAFEALGKAMAEGEKISISGFGTFEVRERAERQGINPRTREPITIAASKSIVFKPGKALKDTPSAKTPSQLMQWPVQIKLVPVNAPYFDGADLLVAADCTAYACGSFHSDFMTGKITVIGCPKLDATDYSEKLGEIVKRNNICSITVARMEVPCCGGIEHAVRKAVTDSGKNIPVAVRIITTDGNVI